MAKYNGDIIDDINNIFVNGPINAMRLEGSINDVKKSLYLFCDYHKKVEYQTQCPSFLSEDFIRYFVKSMKKTDKNINYDLFFEVGPSFHQGTISNFRGKYIDEMYKFFKSSINISKTNDKIENLGSKTDSNLRLHYIDIRDYLKSFINMITRELHEIIDNSLCKQYIYLNSLEKMKSNSSSLVRLFSRSSLRKAS